MHALGADEPLDAQAVEAIRAANGVGNAASAIVHQACRRRCRRRRCLFLKSPNAPHRAVDAGGEASGGDPNLLRHDGIVRGVSEAVAELLLSSGEGRCPGQSAVELDARASKERELGAGSGGMALTHCSSTRKEASAQRTNKGQGYVCGATHAARTRKERHESVWPVQL